MATEFRYRTNSARQGTLQGLGPLARGDHVMVWAHSACRTLTADSAGLLFLTRTSSI